MDEIQERMKYYHKEGKGFIDAKYEKGKLLDIEMGGEFAAILALIEACIEELCSANKMDYYEVMQELAVCHTLHSGQNGD